jgi:hypothetical protein
MSPRSKKEYIEAVFLRYKKADRSQKKVILDEFCRTSGYHRKHAIRVLRGFKRFTAPKPGQRGRRPQYQQEEILKPLKQIWLAVNLPCSKRLKVILPLWLPGYSQAFAPLSPKVIRALCAISAATIDRILQPVRLRYKTHGRTTTKPGTLLRTHIPIKTNQWDETRPAILRPIPWPIAAPLCWALLCIRSIWWTSLPAGPSSGQSGVKERPHSLGADPPGGAVLAVSVTRLRFG